jgi:gluconate 2-dehydrogenase alpha chain
MGSLALDSRVDAPAQGQLVDVRERRFAVTDVDRSSLAPQTLVSVGRNATHQAAMTRAVNLFFDRPLNRFMGSGANAAVMSDLDGDNFDHGPLDFIRGAELGGPSYGYAPISTFGLTPSGVNATWGSEWKKEAIKAFDHTGYIFIAGEHLAYKTNYFDLDPTYRDAYGDPLLRMTMDWSDNERRLMSYMLTQALQIGRALGAREVVTARVPQRYDVNSYKTTHLQGGAIMGDHPGNSVVNRWLQHWQMSNLFVVGASSFPQNPSGNPTLTLLAQTLRSADAIVRTI